MRALLWLLLLAALATGLAVAARYNDGYALLVMPPWRVELSLNLLLFLLLAACVAAYFLLHGIAAIMRMPAAVSAYRARRARARADSALRDAMLHWQEGRFSQAIKDAEQSFEAGHARGLAALNGARALEESNKRWAEKGWPPIDVEAITVCEVRVPTASVAWPFASVVTVEPGVRVRFVPVSDSVTCRPFTVAVKAPF